MSIQYVCVCCLAGLFIGPLFLVSTECQLPSPGQLPTEGQMLWFSLPGVPISPPPTEYIQNLSPHLVWTKRHCGNLFECRQNQTSFYTPGILRFLCPECLRCRLDSSVYANWILKCSYIISHAHIRIHKEILNAKCLLISNDAALQWLLLDYSASLCTLDDLLLLIHLCKPVSLFCIINSSKQLNEPSKFSLLVK